ncbi:MAG: hypothetical protein EGP68_13100 [Lachnospiraceae bacterium]|nr:hypothetical protein [Lachnospiraceae bacterium]
MAQRSDTGDLRRAGNTQKEQQAGHFEKEVLPVFLSYRKLCFYTDKTLRADRTAAEWKNVACATRRRRRILLRRILFYHCLRYSPGEIPSTFLNMREK